jgi:hypothetical protein
MRSAGFWAGTAGILAVLAVSAPSLAQQSVSAQVSATRASTTKVSSVAQAKPAASAHAATTHTIHTAAATHAVRGGSNAPQVFLLKGLADVFSSGLDKLAARLHARGINGQVASHASWDTLADTAIARYRAGQRGAIIVAGHSLGADAAVDFARRLYDAKVPVALVITFGPLQFRPVMGNVARAVNYYQSNSAWHGQILRGKDFRGSLANVNLDNAADVNHFNIEKVDRIQIEAVNKIAAAIGGARKAPAAAAAPATANAAEPAASATGTATEQKPADGTAAAGAAPAKAN